MYVEVILTIVQFALLSIAGWFIGRWISAWELRRKLKEFKVTSLMLSERVMIKDTADVNNLFNFLTGKFVTLPTNKDSYVHVLE